MLPLYVINLARSVDRFARMRAQFSQFGLDFTRIEAVDAFALSIAQRQHVQAHNIWTQNLTEGEIACFLSHRRALERFISDQAPYGVIFEDDVTLGSGAYSLLSEAGWLDKMADRAGQDIEIVKLETAGKKLWMGPALPFEVQGLEAFSLARIKSTHIMAAAYLVSRQAALRLLDLMQEASAPFDHFLFNFSLGQAQKFSLYQLQPAIAIQAGLASTLEGERIQFQRQLKEKRRLRQLLAREGRRLIRRAVRGIWGIKVNLMTLDAWKRVPFQSLSENRSQK